ncbi:hypothetical protein JCM10003_3977 [Bacteroides pyogenes JCM 10003]|nr:hypothetical protein JCM10003_3977 [Bacteroides pyogenes JCM 10003]
MVFPTTVSVFCSKLTFSDNIPSRPVSSLGSSMLGRRACINKRMVLGSLEDEHENIRLVPAQIPAMNNFLFMAFIIRDLCLKKLWYR